VFTTVGAPIWATEVPLGVTEVPLALVDGKFGSARSLEVDFTAFTAIVGFGIWPGCFNADAPTGDRRDPICVPFEFPPGSNFDFLLKVGLVCAETWALLSWAETWALLFAEELDVSAPELKPELEFELRVADFGIFCWSLFEEEKNFNLSNIWVGGIFDFGIV
jgi:hypothetical protein